MAAISSSLASYDKLTTRNPSSHSLSSSAGSSSDRTRHRSKSPAPPAAANMSAQKKPILRLVIIKNAYHQVLTIASDPAAASASSSAPLASQVYSWSAPSHTLTANTNSHFSILRYQAHQPPIPLYAPESGVQVLFRFGSPPKYVGTEQDGILRAVNNPNSFCIWTMQAFEGGFFSLTHPTKKVLVVKDASLALASVEGAGWEKMFKMEVAPMPPGAAAATGPRSNSPPKSSPRFAPSTGSSPSKQQLPPPQQQQQQQQQPPRASIATSVATPEPSNFINRADAPPMPRLPSNPQLRPPGPPQSGQQQDRPGSYAPPPQNGGYVPPQRPQMQQQQQRPPPPSQMQQQQQQQQGGPGQRPMSQDSVASYNNNGPPPGMQQQRPPMMQGGPGLNGPPRPPMMQGGPGPNGPPRPPMMQGGPGPGGPGGPPRPPMPPGTSGPGAPAPPGGTAMLSTPISFTDIRAHFIQRSPSSPNKFIMHKVDTRTDAHLAMYFTLHLAAPDPAGGVKPGGAVDLNAAHRAKVLVQCCGTEQFLGAANKELVEMSKPAGDACTWEFLKLPHNPLAFALAHPATNCVLAASGAGKAARHMTLVPHAAKAKDTQSSFLLYIPASLSAAVQQQQVAGQERPWIQKAMPWIQAAGAVGGIATAGALVANIMITNAKSAPAAPAAGGAGTQGTAPVNAGRMEDGGAAGAGGAGVQAQQMQDGGGLPSDIQLGAAGSEQVMLADGPLPDVIPASAQADAGPQAQPDATTAASTEAAAAAAVATDAPAVDFAPLDTAALDAAFTQLDQVDASGFDVGGGMTQADVDAMVHDFAHADLAAAGGPDGLGGEDVGLEEFGLHVGEDGAVHHVGMDGGDDGGD